MARRAERGDDESDSPLFGEDEGEYCKVCHQEYTGSCPISSAQCPFEAGEEEDDEETEDDPDFEDVKDLDEVLDDDEEADRLTDDDDAPPKGFDDKD